MKRFRQIASALVVALASLSAGGEVMPQGSHLPARIDGELGPEGPPVWAALEVVAPGGVLRPGVLSEGALNELESQIQRIRSLPARQGDSNSDAHGSGTAAPCKMWSTIHLDLLPGASADTAQELVENAAALLRARVVEARAGFFHEMLGTLLAVEVAEVLKDTSTASVPRVLRVFVYDAQVQINGEWLCRGRESDPARPKAGSEVLLFLSTEQLANSNLVLAPLPDHFWFQNGDKLVLPPRFKSEFGPAGPLSIDSLQEAVLHQVSPKAGEP